MPVFVPLPPRRLAATLALVVLPLSATAACGGSATSGGDREPGQAAGQSTGQTAEAALQRASSHLGDSESLSVTLRLEDEDGRLAAAATDGEDGATPEQAELLLGGSIVVTVDPADGRTLREAQTAEAGLSPAEQLRLTNLAMTVRADDADLVQVRLVAGDLYLAVGLDAITEIAREGGSAPDLAAQLDELAAQAPGDLQPLLADLRAGRWLRLPLAPYAQMLSELGEQAAPTPSADPQALGRDLLAAVRPFLTVSDATTSGDERVLDVEVQAKQALQAAVRALAASGPALPGLDAADLSAFDRLGDGTVKGQVTLEDDHLRELTVDLASAAGLAPAGSSPAPDLSGGRVVLEVDDSADEVSVPGDVSPVDVSALVGQLLGSVMGSLPS